MENKIIQFFSLDIYPKNYIEKAIVDYINICKIDLAYDGSTAKCTFYNSVTDLEITVKEFSNYLIEIINSRSIIC